MQWGSMWWDVDELWCGVASSELRLPRFIVDDGRIPEAKALFDDGTPFQRRNADDPDLPDTAGSIPLRVEMVESAYDASPSTTSKS